MSYLYERAPEYGPGLRLHLNENGAGCSPSTIAAIREVTRHDVGFYPDYASVTRACAEWLGVGEDQVLLTNGLDEGIYVAALAYLQRDDRGRQSEAIVPEPAYALYASCTGLAGGRVILVPPGPDFAFPTDDVVARITPSTRAVYLANPNNPSGVLVPRESIRAIARALPGGAVVFLDEAYADFASENFLGELAEYPNVIIGRTFAKAHGLAAVRAGYVVAAPSIIARLTEAALPFTVNVFALAAMRAAIRDPDYLHWYVDQVAVSRRLIYAACARLGLQCWPSEGNFVLVRVGALASGIVERLASRGVFVRDRSRMAGCEGCIRITAGLVEHTDECLVLLEAVCAEA